MAETFVPRGMGWKPGKPHVGDKWLKFVPVSLPASNPRFATGLPPIWDQGQLGSCTAHGIIRAYLFAAAKQGVSVPMLSRLQLYYDERVIEGTINQDAGAAITDGLTTLNQQGVCPESEWPYDESAFATKPLASCYTDALKHEAIDNAKVAVDINQVKAVLAAGYPVIIGFTCYSSLQSSMTAATGVVPMPRAFEAVVGGHCVTLNGYWDDAKQLIGFDNSWSESWGKSGSGYFPYAYFSQNLMDDFWVIHKTNDAVLPVPGPPAPAPTPTPVPPSPLADTITIQGKAKVGPAEVFYGVDSQDGRAVHGVYV